MLAITNVPAAELTDRQLWSTLMRCLVALDPQTRYMHDRRYVKHAHAVAMACYNELRDRGQQLSLFPTATGSERSR